MQTKCDCAVAVRQSAFQVLCEKGFAQRQLRDFRGTLSAGDDLIFGDDGDDTIMGGTGDDTFTGDDFSGGTGSDLFVFGNGDGTDTIIDFDVSEDLIGLVEGTLTFEDIEVIEIDGNAAINSIETEETLLILEGVEPDELTSDLFIITSDFYLG